MSTADIIEIPLSELGLDPRPRIRQVRPIDQEHVERLKETGTPEHWPPIIVRPWPETDPKPAGEVDAGYQVISGYHRTTAARLLELPTLRAVVRHDILTDADFILLATGENLRHGLGMTREQLQESAHTLKSLGMSLAEIGQRLGVPRGTIHNWLSGRNTNKGRVLRTQQHSAADSEPIDELPSEWRTETVSLDAGRVAEIGGHLNKALNLGDLAALIPPSDAASWLARQSPAMRRVLAQRFGQIGDYWHGMAACARLGGAAAGGEEVAHDAHQA